MAETPFQGSLGQLITRHQSSTKTVAQLIAAYSTMPWLRSVTHRISSTVASTPWKVLVATNSRTGEKIRNRKIQKAGYEKRRELIKAAKDRGEIEEIHEHPLLDVLDAGNAYLTGRQNNQLNQIYIDIVGESFLLKQRNNAGKTASLWVVPPTWCREVAVPGRDWWEFEFYGKQARYEMDDVIWIKEVDPVDPFGRGAGAGKSLADELDADEFAAKHIKDFFLNGARPDLLITADGLSKADTQRLEAAWNSKLKGLFKRFKPFFLSKSVDVKELNTSFRDSQLTELRKFERDLIIQAFNIPPEVMGIIENSNRATVTAADYLFGKYVVRPRLELQRSIYQERLVPEFDDRIILDFEDPVDEDKEFKLSVYEKAPQAFYLDEVRCLAGDPPLDNDAGNVRMVPFNLVEVRDDGSEVDTSEPVNDVVEGEPAKAIAKALDNQDVEFIVNTAQPQVFVANMAPALQDAVTTFGQDAIDSANADLTFDVLDPRVEEFVQTQTLSRMTTTVNETTKTNLRDSIYAGIEANETQDQLAKRIKEVFTNATAQRARTIARTESVRAANFGAYTGMQQAGVTSKEWLSSRDERVRDAHTELDGSIIPINADFVSNATGARAKYPGEFGQAEDDINCRCQVLSVVNPNRSADNLTKDMREQRWKAFEETRRPYEELLVQATIKSFDSQLAAALNAFNQRI